jgi:ribonuclease PH
MLPRSTLIRTPRNSNKTGRNQEIQRLIGRSLRAVTNLDALGERSFIVDCDVLQADGGTRTAAVTGGYIALCQTFHNLVKRGVLPFLPLDKKIAAVSVGIVEGEALLDLCYEEDYRAEVDFNVVMTDKKEFVEIQGAAERKPFSREKVEELLSLAEQGINTIFKIQQDILQSLQ